jgi:hypothetical protein
MQNNCINTIRLRIEKLILQIKLWKTTLFIMWLKLRISFLYLKDKDVRRIKLSIRKTTLLTKWLQLKLLFVLVFKKQDRICT